MSEQIGPYVLTAPLTNTDAGNCRWGFATRGAQNYFIKELLNPVYPIDEVNLKPQVIARKRKLCERFEASQSLVLRRINEASDGNVMRIVEFFRYGSKYYLVAEKTDAIKLEKIERLPYEARLHICRVLAHALMCLHEAGLVNGDIKPNNILLYKTRSGGISARIIDVDGCYFKVMPPTNPDDIATDQSYMAPEVFAFIRDECGHLDEKSDIFSMGLCMHEILAGAPVTLAADSRYPFQHVIDHGKPILSERLRAEERDLIGRMLEENPADRPTARQVFVRLWHGAPPVDMKEDIKPGAAGGGEQTGTGGKSGGAGGAGGKPGRAGGTKPSDDTKKPSGGAGPDGGGSSLKRMRAPTSEGGSWFRPAGNL